MTLRNLCLMTATVFALFLACNPAYSAGDIRSQLAADGCDRNCIQFTTVDNRHTLVALGKSGQLLRMEPLAIPPVARPDQSNWQTGTATFAGVDDGDTRQRVYYQTYTSQAGTWVVVTLITYDADNNIIDVQSHTTFFPSGKVN